MVPPGVEPGLSESESDVITVYTTGPNDSVYIPDVVFILFSDCIYFNRM